MTMQFPSEPPAVNLQGQALGRKGHLTRMRLIATLEGLLKHRPLRDLRVMDICREAKTAPGTFYLYFRDVEDLALEAIRKGQELPSELNELLDEDWPIEQSFEYSKRFIGRYVTYWEERYHLLHMRNLAADEGSQSMVDLRHACVVPLMEQLARKIRKARATQCVEDNLNPLAAATVIMASLERLAAVFRFHATLRSDMSVEDVVTAQAWVLAMMLGQQDISAPELPI